MNKLVNELVLKLRGIKSIILLMLCGLLVVGCNSGSLTNMERSSPYLISTQSQNSADEVAILVVNNTNDDYRFNQDGLNPDIGSDLSGVVIVNAHASRVIYANKSQGKEIKFIGFNQKDPAKKSYLSLLIGNNGNVITNNTLNNSGIVIANDDLGFSVSNSNDYDSSSNLLQPFRNIHASYKSALTITESGDIKAGQIESYPVGSYINTCTNLVVNSNGELSGKCDNYSYLAKIKFVDCNKHDIYSNQGQLKCLLSTSDKLSQVKTQLAPVSGGVPQNISAISLTEHYMYIAIESHWLTVDVTIYNTSKSGKTCSDSVDEGICGSLSTADEELLTKNTKPIVREKHYITMPFHAIERCDLSGDNCVVLTTYSNSQIPVSISFDDAGFGFVIMKNSKKLHFIRPEIEHMAPLTLQKHKLSIDLNMWTYQMDDFFTNVDDDVVHNFEDKVNAVSYVPSLQSVYVVTAGKELKKCSLANLSYCETIDKFDDVPIDVTFDNDGNGVVLMYNNVLMLYKNDVYQSKQATVSGAWHVTYHDEMIYISSQNSNAAPYINKITRCKVSNLTSCESFETFSSNVKTYKRDPQSYGYPLIAINNSGKLMGAVNNLIYELELPRFSNYQYLGSCTPVDTLNPLDGVITAECKGDNGILHDGFTILDTTLCADNSDILNRDGSLVCEKYQPQIPKGSYLDSCNVGYYEQRQTNPDYGVIAATCKDSNGVYTFRELDYIHECVPRTTVSVSPNGYLRCDEYNDYVDVNTVSLLKMQGKTDELKRLFDLGKIK